MDSIVAHFFAFVVIGLRLSPALDRARNSLLLIHASATPTAAP